MFRYCQTSHLNVWKLVCKLQSPETFAAFIETGNHISEDERQKHLGALRSGDFDPELLERPRPSLEEVSLEPEEPLQGGTQET